MICLGVLMKNSDFVLTFHIRRGKVRLHGNGVEEKGTDDRPSFLRFNVLEPPRYFAFHGVRYLPGHLVSRS